MLGSMLLTGSVPKDEDTSGGCEPMAEVVRCGSSRILGTGACGLVSLLLHCVKLVLGIGQGTRGHDVPRHHLRLCDGVI